MYHQQKNQSPNRTTILNQETTLLVNYHEDQSLATLKDSVISLEFRIKTLESQINSKMERDQCFTLMERKCNTSYVKKNFQQIYTKLEADRIKQQNAMQKIQQQQKIKIVQLKTKLKEINSRQMTQLGSPLAKQAFSFNFTENMTKKINKVLVKPQQLYLESNQTMFSMLIDEIKELKSKDNLIERLIESKHKKTVSLNNQVCRKLQFLENQLEQTIKYMDSLQLKTVSVSQQSQTKKPLKKSASKTQNVNQYVMEKMDTGNSQNQNQAYEMIRLQLLTKSIQSVQKELSHKLNIKDVIPLIKQNVPLFQDTFNEMKSYIEQNFESMRKILSNQSEINEQISKVNRIGWWHCYEKLQVEESERSQQSNEGGYILFTKQIMNIIPQCVLVEEGFEHTLKIVAKGWYLIEIFQPSTTKQSVYQNSNDAASVWIQINRNIKEPILHKKLLNLTIVSEIRLITQAEDLFVSIQKL